eukprot:6175342-Pleurochrysis_carterae.AAC.4
MLILYEQTCIRRAKAYSVVYHGVNAAQDILIQQLTLKASISSAVPSYSSIDVNTEQCCRSPTGGATPWDHAHINPTQIARLSML